MYSIVVSSDDGKAPARKVVLTGSDALKSRFETCSCPGTDPTSADLKEFRSFRCMLSEEQNAVVDEWQRVGIVSAKEKSIREKEGHH